VITTITVLLRSATHD